MEEIWKPVVGYEGLYEISNLGNVKSLNFHKEWDSIISIQNELGILASNISSCCNKRIKTAYGFKWEFTKHKQIT